MLGPRGGVAAHARDLTTQPGQAAAQEVEVAASGQQVGADVGVETCDEASENIDTDIAAGITSSAPVGMAAHFNLRRDAGLRER